MTQTIPEFDATKANIDTTAGRKYIEERLAQFTDAQVIPAGGLWLFLKDHSREPLRGKEHIRDAEGAQCISHSPREYGPMDLFIRTCGSCEYSAGYCQREDDDVRAYFRVPSRAMPPVLDGRQVGPHCPYFQVRALE